ncbi:hypothetical protein D9611_012140 [Ephemerocybe angulata]|uniref:F-box domain-containing protein n=1 Tax=Ephemerocybe angulata TaxID=980116 RepID=A0A8H5C5M6_9AGAR|nr:hypothetical protein D9611_012140 [Tulosesus angulatus]
MDEVPQEIANEILAHVAVEGTDAVPTLLSCARVSIKFYAAATSHIYRKIKVHFFSLSERHRDFNSGSVRDGHQAQKRVKQLASSFRAKPSLGNLVERFTLCLVAQPAAPIFSKDDCSLVTAPDDPTLINDLILILSSLNGPLSYLKFYTNDGECSRSSAPLQVASNWAVSNTELTTQILRLCNLPTLRTLHLTSFTLPCFAWIHNPNIGTLSLDEFNLPYSIHLQSRSELVPQGWRAVQQEWETSKKKTVGRGVQHIMVRSRTKMEPIGVLLDAYPTLFDGLITATLAVGFPFIAEMPDRWLLPLLKHSSGTLGELSLIFGCSTIGGVSNHFMDSSSIKLTRLNVLRLSIGIDDPVQRNATALGSRILSIFDYFIQNTGGALKEAILIIEDNVVHVTRGEDHNQACILLHTLLWWLDGRLHLPGLKKLTIKVRHGTGADDPICGMLREDPSIFLGLKQDIGDFTFTFQDRSSQ